MTARSLLMALTAAPIFAAPPQDAKPAQPEAPPVFNSTAAPYAPPAQSGPYVYEQKPMAGRQVLVSPEQAAGLIERFKDAYPKLGSPRIVMTVNRELVDENSGLKLSGRTERTQSNRTEVNTAFKPDPNAPSGTAQPGTGATIPPASNLTIVGNVNGLNGNQLPGERNVNTETEKKTREDNYKYNQKSAETLADRQTVRDVERLFGRPLRMAGVTLADQRTATQLISDAQKGSATEGEQARKDREALGKIADVAVEVLISSRQITVPELSGEKTYVIPDIQATAVRLSDSTILGQASASDIIGKDRYAGNIARTFDAREIAEATALALMEDMLLNVPTDEPANE